MSQARSLPTSSHQLLASDWPTTDEVFLWQVEMLTGLGFHVEDAEVIAASGIEWHAVRALLGRGCPHHLVLKII